jgi:hypothetical protein
MTSLFNDDRVDTHKLSSALLINLINYVLLLAVFNILTTIVLSSREKSSEHWLQARKQHVLSLLSDENGQGTIQTYQGENRQPL